MDKANQYLKETYLPAFNAEFAHSAREDSCAFVSWISGTITDYLCEAYERTVTKDNCVKFETLTLQIPKDPHRYHYGKAIVSVRNHLDGTISINYGPRELGRYTRNGELIEDNEHQAAA